MTEPDTEPKNAGVNVGIAGSMQMGPDGKQWGVLHITGPVTHTAVLVPESGLASLATELPKMLAELADTVRQANSGIVLAHTIPQKGNTP